MKELKRGDTLQVTIEAATVDGTGIARVDGQVVFVPGALPGELCRIRIAHIGHSAVFAELLRVEQPSAHRVEPDCPYFPKCGGCALRHMDYAQELELKRAHVYNCLTRIGGQTLASLPITGAEQTDGYRNKVQFPVQEQNGKPVAGFFAGKTHTVIPAAHCRIQPDCADRIRAAVLDWMRKYSIRAYDEAAHTGYIRHIYIRFGAESGQILVCITANTQQLPKKKQLVQTLLAAEPGITTIVFSPNTKKGNTVLGTEFLPLYGDGTITDTLCGLQFRLSAPAFYQVNHAQAERLYEKAAALAGLTFQQIQKYERGMNRIGASRLYDFAQILEVPVRYFFAEMPEEVAQHSPRRYNGIICCNGDVPQLPEDPAHSAEIQSLIRAYSRITNREAARALLALSEKMAPLAACNDKKTDMA